MVVDFPEPMAKDNGGVYAVGDHRCQDIVGLHCIHITHDIVNRCMNYIPDDEPKSDIMHEPYLDPFEAKVESQDSF